MRRAGILRLAMMTALLSVFCPAVALALSFTVSDDFDDGNYDGWTVVTPAGPPLLYVSPEGFAVGGAGPMPAGITHPLNVVGTTELSLAMRAASGPDALSSLLAWSKTEGAVGHYYEGSSSNGSAIFTLRDAGGIEQVFTYGGGSLAGWHTFEWARDAEGRWSLYLDGLNVDPNFVRDDRLTSFVSADLYNSDAQSQVEWVQVTATSAPTARGLAIEPNTLNLKSEGRWITCRIDLGESYDVRDIDVNTVLLNGEVPAELRPTATGDRDGDGGSSLMVKFDRSAVQEILEVGDAVTITVTGVLTDGVIFSDSDIIRVIDPGRAGKPETNPGLDGKPEDHPGNHGKPETNPGQGKK